MNTNILNKAKETIKKRKRIDDPVFWEYAEKGKSLFPKLNKENKEEDDEEE